MTTPLTCLLLFAGWTLLPLLLVLAPIRILAVLRGKAKAGDFPADQPHGTDFYRRIMRAHMNCVENLPIFGTVVVVGTLAGISSTTFDHLAIAAIVARVGQTIAHVASGRGLVINIRFTFFAIQVGCFIAMGVMCVMGAVAH